MDPIYIIKFMKEQYISTLIDCQLFYANPAGYYWKCENGIGDKNEGLASSGPWEPINKIQIMSMYKGAETPIFCSYAVMKSDIQENCIFVDRRIDNDFDKDNTMAVVMNYSSFLDAINSCEDVKNHGLVNYYDSFSVDMELASKDNLNLFYKENKYSYQKEYRIIFNGSVKGVVKSFYEYSFEKNCAKKYHFEKHIVPICICRLSNCRNDDNGLYIELTG